LWARSGPLQLVGPTSSNRMIGRVSAPLIGKLRHLSWLSSPSTPEEYEIGQLERFRNIRAHMNRQTNKLETRQVGDRGASAFLRRIDASDASRSLLEALYVR
jgi:hypothetical protein